MSNEKKEQVEDFSNIVLNDVAEEKIVKDNIEPEIVKDGVVKKEESTKEESVAEVISSEGAKDITGEILKEIKNSDVEDFKRIPNISEIREGIVTFKVENCEILKAFQVFKSTESSVDVSNIIIIVGKRDLTLVNTYDSDFFVKTVIPLKGESSVKKGYIGFRVPFNFLFQTISRQGTEETLSYKYEVGAKKFSICLSDGDINITAEKDIKSDIKNIIKKSKIETNKIQEIENIDALKAGLKYISLFVKNNKDNVNLGIVEIKDSMIFGGNLCNVGIFQSEKLKGLDFKIPGKAILNAIVKIFDTFFTDDGISIWESESTKDQYSLDGKYLYITDGDSCIRFFKKTDNFPAERALVLDVDISKRITTPRSKFIENIDSLSYVSDDLNITVDTENEKYVGEVLDYCGLSSNRSFEVKASGKICQETFIQIGEFLKVLKHFNSDNVEMCFHKAEAELIVLLDEVEDYKIRTVLVANDKDEEGIEDGD